MKLAFINHVRAKRNHAFTSMLHRPLHFSEFTNQPTSPPTRWCFFLSTSVHINMKLLIAASPFAFHSFPLLIALINIHKYVICYIRGL